MSDHRIKSLINSVLKKDIILILLLQGTNLRALQKYFYSNIYTYPQYKITDECMQRWDEILHIICQPNFEELSFSFLYQKTKNKKRYSFGDITITGRGNVIDISLYIHEWETSVKFTQKCNINFDEFKHEFYKTIVEIICEIIFQKDKKIVDI